MPRLQIIVLGQTLFSETVQLVEILSVSDVEVAGNKLPRLCRKIHVLETHNTSTSLRCSTVSLSPLEPWSEEWTVLELVQEAVKDSMLHDLRFIRLRGHQHEICRVRIEARSVVMSELLELPDQNQTFAWPNFLKCSGVNKHEVFDLVENDVLVTLELVRNLSDNLGKLARV